MKKIFKIILANIILLIVTVSIIEATYIYSEYIKASNDVFYISNENILKKQIKEYIRSFYAPKYYYDFKSPIGSEYENMPSIILLGCSNTFGYYLEENETLQYLLSKKLKRTVYNVSVIGGSPREILYILRNKDILKEALYENNNNNVEYVIYNYITDHKKRIIADLYKRSPKFKIINNGNNLKYVEPFFYENLYTYRKINSYIAEKTFKSQKNYDLFCLYIKEIKEQTDLLFNNSGKPVKFIFFVYENYDHSDWKKLEEYGIQVVKANKILDVNIQDVEYRISETNYHPNAKAWEIVVPALIKELNMDN